MLCCPRFYVSRPFLADHLRRASLWGAVLLFVLLARPVDAPAQSSSPGVDAAADTTVTVAVQRHLIRGTTAAQLGDHEKALSHFEAALEQAPNAPILLAALGDAYQAQGDLATALFYTRQAQQRGADRPYYFRRIAAVQRAAGEIDAALRTYARLLDRFPSQHGAWRDRARLQAKANRPAAALTSLDAYLRHAPSPPLSVYELRLSLYRDTRDTTGVVETLQTLVERRPGNEAYRRQLGSLFAKTGRPAAAVDALAPVARWHPQDRRLQRRLRRLAREAEIPPGDVPALGPTR